MPTSPKFDLYPDFSVPPKDRTGELQDLFDLLKGNQNVVFLAPGDYYFKVLSGNYGKPIIGDLPGRNGIRLVGEGARLIHVWDPTVPNSLGPFYVGNGGSDHSFEGFTYEPSPRLDFQGIVLLVNNTFQIVGGIPPFGFTVQVPAQYRVSWLSGDNVLRMKEFNDGTYGCDAWRYELGGWPRPFDFTETTSSVENPPGVFSPAVYTVKYMTKDAALTSAVGKATGTDNLEFTTDNKIINNSTYVRPVDYGSYVGTAINNTMFKVEVQSSGAGMPTVFRIRTVPGNVYAATLQSTSNALTKSSAMTILGVPDWIAADEKIVVQYQKHGKNPFFARGVKGDLRFDNVRFKGASAVPLYIWDFETLYLDVEGRGDGYLSANAGPVNVFNGKRIIGPGIRWFGSGDDVFNPRTRSWQGKVPTPGHETLTPDPFPDYPASQAWNQGPVSAGAWIDVKFNVGNTIGNNPTAPSVGDRIEITPPGSPVGEQVLTVKSVAPAPVGTGYTRVTFVETSLPTFSPVAFSPVACRILNRSTVPVVDLERVASMACGGRTLVCQSHDMRIGTVVSIGTRFSNILATSSPGGQDDGSGDLQLGDGGFRGGLHIGRYIARHSTRDALADAKTDARALLRVEAKAFDQTALTAPSGWPQVTIGFLDADDYPYTVVSAECVDVAVGSRSVRNGGTRRYLTSAAPIPDPTPGHGNFDYSARYATVHLAGDNAASYLENKEDDPAGGNVVLYPSYGTPFHRTTAVWLRTGDPRPAAQPARAKKSIYDDLVQGLWSAGLGADIGLLALFANTANEPLALHDVFAPQRLFSKANGANLVWTPDRGYASSIDGYIDTGYVLGSDGIVTKNSMTLLVCCSSDSASPIPDLSAGNTLSLNTRNNGMMVAHLGNTVDVSQTLPSPVSSLGVSAATRNGTMVKLYRNGSPPIFSGTESTATALPTFPLKLCGNVNGASGRQISLAYVSSFKTDNQIATLRTLFATCLSGLGVPV